MKKKKNRGQNKHTKMTQYTTLLNETITNRADVPLQKLPTIHQMHQAQWLNPEDADDGHFRLVHWQNQTLVFQTAKQLGIWAKEYFGGMYPIVQSFKECTKDSKYVIMQTNTAIELHKVSHGWLNYSHELLTSIPVQTMDKGRPNKGYIKKDMCRLISNELTKISQAIGSMNKVKHAIHTYNILNTLEGKLLTGDDSKLYYVVFTKLIELCNTPEKGHNFYKYFKEMFGVTWN